MSYGGDLPKTCKFGHVLDIWGDGENDSMQKKIRNGEIKGIDDLDDDQSFDDVLKQWKYLKFRSPDQGSAYTGMWVAVDELTTNKDYTVNKISESIHISPQSQMHTQFMERKQQAENNIKQTMKGYQDMMKQKHMLEHDIRKLRSRVEAVNARDETLLKGDFIELVDGANAGSQQGGEAAMKTLVERNIYPTLVSDFQEMEGVEDLETADDRAKRYDDKDKNDLDDGILSDVPANEKAVLKKKWKMYEQWKDLYGSEVQRKLKELKGQLKNIERSLEETEEWLRPYVKDVAMIHKMGDDQEGANSNLNVRGNSTMKRDIEFLVHKPMKLEEGEMLLADNEEEATHFRVVKIKTVHVNIAGWEQPQSPAQGPSAGIVMWFPFFCCRHVFKNFIEPRIKEFDNLVKDMMDDYTGDFETSEGIELKKARNDKEMSIRELRETIEDKLDDQIPLEVSSNIRRVEDGLEKPEDAIKSDYLEKIDEILDTKFSLEDEDSPDKEMYSGVNKKMMNFLGQSDPYKIPQNLDPLGDFTNDLRFEYYWGLKMDFGMYTMK